MSRTTLVFDAGNTLIEEIDGAIGPMVDWPVLRAIPGIQAALDILAPQYNLAVGSNARDSSLEQIRAAMKRVGLDGMFRQVFTAPLLDASKPERGFFRGIEQQLGAHPDQLVMVGDIYALDVLGAVQAGWRAVWYNPSNRPAPGLCPLHSIEINHFDQLADELSRSNLPSYVDCLAMHQSGKSSFRLLEHVELVAAAAYQMALWLRSRGVQVNPVLAHRGGLTHDIAKMADSDRENPDHAAAAASWLSGMGQPELASIARTHSLFSLVDPDLMPRSWEEKLVYLADKMVEGSTYVTVQQRLAALKERYQIPEGILAPLRPRLIELEAEFSSAAGIPPEELAGRLAAAAFGTDS